jgi:hypothetical protein
VRSVECYDRKTTPQRSTTLSSPIGRATTYIPVESLSLHPQTDSLSGCIGDADSTGTALTASGGTATLDHLAAWAHTSADGNDVNSADGNDVNSADGIVDGGVYCIENVNSGKVLEVDSAGTSDGDPVQQWEYLGYDHQKWVAHEVAEGRYWFENVNSGKALDVVDAGTSQGDETMQWGY